MGRPISALPGRWPVSICHSGMGDLSGGAHLRPCFDIPGNRASCRAESCDFRSIGPTRSGKSYEGGGSFDTAISTGLCF